MKPKISIIVPVYNGANFLREAIDSALAQTYENTEIIVVNDGSQDDGATDNIARSYGNKIRYFQKENAGASSALNMGIRQMRGEFFSWLSHDDLYLPEKLEKSYAAWENGGDQNTMVVCKGSLINGQGKPLLSKKNHIAGKKTAQEAFGYITQGKGINGCAVLIPKAVLDKVGFFDESMVYLNDLDYWYRILLHNVNVIYLDEELIQCRIHDEQVSVKKIGLYNGERHYLAQKTLQNADEILIDKPYALSRIARFCASENLQKELQAAKTRLKSENAMTVRLRFCLWQVRLCGFAKRFLRYLRKKLFFGR